MFANKELNFDQFIIYLLSLLCHPFSNNFKRDQQWKLYIFHNFVLRDIHAIRNNAIYMLLAQHGCIGQKLLWENRTQVTPLSLSHPKSRNAKVFTSISSRDLLSPENNRLREKESGWRGRPGCPDARLVTPFRLLGLVSTFI